VYDKKVVRRRRAVLGALVGLSLILLTAYFGSPTGGIGGGLHAIQRGAQETLAPIESGATHAFKPFSDLAGWTGDVLDAKGENGRLKDEVARLREGLARAQTDQREAEQLRELVGLPLRAGFPVEVDRLTARVIARSPTVWYSAVQIDAGTADGVRVDQPVIAGAGLVGKVTSATTETATVTLITDASSAVSAEVMPDGAHGVVKPEVGKPNDLLLDFIEKGGEVTIGATVVTSGVSSSKGLGSLFPRGIPIGKVTRSEREELELYQRVHLAPFADLRRLDIVQVLRSKPAAERAQVLSP